LPPLSGFFDFGEQHASHGARQVGTLHDLLKLENPDRRPAEFLHEKPGIPSDRRVDPMQATIAAELARNSPSAHPV
jgi:hypothetical protein